MKKTCWTPPIATVPLLVAFLSGISIASDQHRIDRIHADPHSGTEVHSSSSNHLRCTVEPGDEFPEPEGATAGLSRPEEGPPAENIVYYFYEPYPMEVGSSIFQIGGSASLLPYPDAEAEIPIPGLDIQYKRGIATHVTYVGSFSTSIFSYLVHTGLQWNVKVERFSVGIANHVGVAYGFISRANQFDDVQAYGLFDMALLRFGYRFDEVSYSCSFVMSYVFKSNSFVNSIEASVGPQRTINDYYCTLVVEQPFLRNQLLTIGISLGYARTPYQSWMLYNTVDEWLFVPEFFFAFQL